jgi:outer membrane receptor protein involved in Fe transport
VKLQRRQIAKRRQAEGVLGERWDPLAQEGTAGAAPYSYFERALGAWIEQTARPLGWLGVNAGARLDFDERFGTHLSPRLAVNGGLWEGGAVKAIYSEAFRTPSAFERYYADPMSFIAAKDLQPEVVRSVELAVEQRFGAQRLLLSLFRSWWSGMVVYEGLSEEEIASAIARGELDPSVTEAFTYKNVSQIDNYGLNLGLDGSVLDRRLRYGVGLTLAKAAMIEDEVESRLQGAAQVFGNAHASYDLGGSLPVLALAGRFTGTRPVVDATFENVDDAPAILELRASATGDVPRATGLSYRVSFDYNPTHCGPYAVGPVDSPVEGYTEQQLNPQPEYMLLVGLQYTLR